MPGVRLVLHSIGSRDIWKLGQRGHVTISRLASHLAIHQSSPKSSEVAEIYGRLNTALIRSIARAFLARELLPSFLFMLVYGVLFIHPCTCIQSKLGNNNNLQLCIKLYIIITKMWLVAYVLIDAHPSHVGWGGAEASYR